MGFSLSGATKGGLQGAGAGAAIGSAFGGIGAGPGALIGGAGGFLLGGFTGDEGSNQGLIDALGNQSALSAQLAQEMYSYYKANFASPEVLAGIKQFILTPEQIQQEALSTGKQAATTAEFRFDQQEKNLARRQLEFGGGDPSSQANKAQAQKFRTQKALGISGAQTAGYRAGREAYSNRTLAAASGLLGAGSPLLGGVSSLMNTSVAGYGSVLSGSQKQGGGLLDGINLGFNIPMGGGGGGTTPTPPGAATGGLVQEPSNIPPETPIGAVPQDRVPMMTEPGEFIFSAEETKLLGLDFMLKGRKKALQVKEQLNVAGNPASAQRINEQQGQNQQRLQGQRVA